MIGKIMPPRRVGTFFGVQAAAANLLGSGGAIGAGILLERIASPLSYVLCFLTASVAFGISWCFLASTREQSIPPQRAPSASSPFWDRMAAILRRDENFRWFLIARMLSQVAMMAFAFYTVYAVRYLGMDVLTAGVMTAVLTATQVIANPVMGWVGDRWGYRLAMQIGAFAAAGSALLAWFAPSIEWFYPIYILAGVAIVAMWTIAMAMTLEFDAGAERPAYIGLSNTLVAPSTFLAPLVGGWLADAAGYSATFLVSAIGGIATAFVLFAMLRNPRQAHQAATIAE
jgi:Na+/melibiose symporter-like transporter